MYIIIFIIIIILSYAVTSLYEKSHDQKTINVVSMTPDEMSSALKDKKIAGFISWEPYPAKAVADGYGRYLVNSKDIWNNHPECVMAVSEYLKDEETIKALIWVHIKSTRFINDPANREKVLEYGSEFTGVDKTTASAAINNTVYIEFPYLKEIKTGFEILRKAGGFKKDLASMGYSNQDDFFSSLIQDKYYNEIRNKFLQTFCCIKFHKAGERGSRQGFSPSRRMLQIRCCCQKPQENHFLPCQKSSQSL